jgi:hypothetical protein
MGVRVRLSRNVSVYLPFWIAIPAWLFAAAVWLVIVVVYVLVWLAVQLGKGTAVLFRSGGQAIADRQPADHPGLEARWQARKNQAAARREAAQPLVTVPSRDARGRTIAPGFEAAHGFVPEDRRASKPTGHRAARKPLNWPLWGFLAAVAMFITSFVLIAVAGPHASQNSPLALAGGSLALAAIPVAAVCVVAAIVRLVRRRPRKSLAGR